MGNGKWGMGNGEMENGEWGMGKWEIVVSVTITEKLEWAHPILVPRASVSFGHVVGETEGSGSSNYRMSVNY